MKETDKNKNIDKKEAKKAKKARKRGRAGRRIAQVLMCFLLTVAFVASAAGGAVAAYYKAATNTITTDTKTALKNADVVDADLEYDQDVVNILLIGCDKRSDETEAGRSDSTMIATIDLKNGKLKLTSLMRDMDTISLMQLILTVVYSLSMRLLQKHLALSLMAMWK